ncbi:MAG: efflux RND transporter permease subunit [Bdellovibrionota bacterium]
MKKLFEYFIDQSFKVNAISFFVLLVGVISFSGIPTQLIPENLDHNVYVNINHDGYDAKTMETQYGFPLEEQFLQISGVTDSRTYIGKGWISFYIQLKRQDLHEEIEKSKRYCRPHCIGITQWAS